MPDLTLLNEAQRRAVTWGEGPLLLLAGPGSGKTFTITNRILYLLEQGAAPEQILAVTFTREAAASMQRRFREMSQSFLPVCFGTFHSVFYHILQRSAGLSRLKLLTGHQKRNLILPILKKYMLQSGGGARLDEAGEDAEKVLSAISFYRNTQEPDRAADKAPAAFRGVFREICSEYDAAVRRDGGMDFDDLLIACRDLLRDRQNAREYWQGCFAHILVDEFQDINPVQYETLKLLSAPPYNVFAVGDDDQSVYGFRGARPELMRRFEKEFGAGRLLLDVNYRSSEQIVRGASAVIGGNCDRFPKSLRPAPGKLGGESAHGLRVRAFPDKEAQNACLIEELSAWLEGPGKAGGNCALLFRTNAGMQRTAARLKRAGIPFVLQEKSRSIYEHFIVRDVMAYLTLAADGGNREALLRILNRPPRAVEREALAAGVSFPELIRCCERESCSEEKRREVRGQLELLQTQLKSLGKMKPGLGVNYVLKAVRYEEFLKKKAAGNPQLWAEWRELLEWMKADAGAYESAAAWLEMQISYTDQLKRQPRTFDRTDGIRLMTAHGSKGLEFDRVYIPDCNEGVFPHGSMPDLSGVEEERRLFYVAMTRAKEALELLYLTGDRVRPRVPSRFLNPLL